MKFIKTVLLLAVVSLATGLGSCSKSSNPADQFADAIEKATKEAKAIKTQEGFQDLQPAIVAADQITKDNADYVMTDADKAKVKKAMSDFFRVVFNKSMELEGHEISEAQIDMMVNMATASIDRSTTLGDLSSPAQQSFESETTIMESSDGQPGEDTEDIVWEKAEKIN